jgi:hypothetical protein
MALTEMMVNAAIRTPSQHISAIQALKTQFVPSATPSPPHQVGHVYARFPVADATALRIRVNRALVQSVPEEQQVFMMLEQEK